MTGAEVRSIREALALTQAQLAQLLGVHSLTVSKWERGVLRPTAHQAALLNSFGQAADHRPGIGPVVIGILLGAGIAAALLLLLKAALDDGPDA